jgi:signal transduction histidine kinase
MAARAERHADEAVGVLDPDPVETWLAERALAVSRMLLSTAFLAVVRLQLRHVAPVGPILNGILIGYALFGGGVLLLLLRQRNLPPHFATGVHAADVVFAAGVTVASGGTVGPFFTLLLYPLFAAAYRWGFREVMITTGSIELLLVAGTLATEQLTLASFVFPAVVVAATGAAAGYLSEEGRRLRFEDRTISLALRRARLGGRLGDTVNMVLASVRTAFRASQVLIVLQEHPTGRMLLWTSNPATDDDTAVHPQQVPVWRRDDYLFQAPGAAWHASARWWRREGFNVVAVDEGGQRTPAAPVAPPPAGFIAKHRFRRLIGVTLRFGQEWNGRLLVIEPGIGVNREQNARFALKLARQISPALYDHYLARQLRTHAQALERRRIARDLHDGVTQSLLGLEMEVVVLQRRAIEEAPQLVSDLARVHRIIRDEVVTVRELMEGIRVGDVQPADMLYHLSELVDRFSRHTGIAGRFISDGKVADLSAYSRREISRIVHEALVNVRKHSGADRVIVKAELVDGSWKLSVEDDGKGFPFGGRRSLAELELQRQGPRTIAERIRIIGGDLVVESKPGFGTRLEISIPVAAEARSESSEVRSAK